ncbi:branched-chain amino acid transport system II carrier protein [Blautia hydrogenotrophica]|uniref:branched-chain amino acid transport system II carrier protein n=1 Tax=Blautia hydrogenotrophica TaxID=53443 RepID=UPI002E79B748|nr:branched-chain amino acid transport system II carrier protein [Blautia hydrogenotrophica]MEE0461149.1 branched-chain amino acid transport system II carrier protein [Blautia hydrogenotrophica]
MTEQKQKQKGGIIVIGFALFAMFFGAGNLIFPPMLGYLGGTNWILGFIAFAGVDVGIAALAVYAMSRGDGTVAFVTNIIGDKLGVVINTAVVLCIGPFLAIPRTGTTTFEMAVQSINPDISRVAEVIFLFAFFAVTLLLTIRQSKVIDIIGKILTPLLVISLIVLIIKGVVTPIGEIGAGMDAASVVNTGIVNGYQTMDVLAALCFSIIIVESARKKGYEGRKECSRAMMGACGISAVLLLFVYGGLTFLGATTIDVYPEVTDNAKLLSMIIQDLLGFGGMVLLGIIVGLACLTTSIGLTSATASYFETLFKGKVSYKTLVVVVTVFSFAVSNIGLNQIIAIASPILSLLYPVVIILVICSFFKDRLLRCYLPGAACLVAFVITCFDTLHSTFGMNFSFLEMLPLDSMGLGWVLPTVIGGLIGFFVPRKAKAAEEA